LDTFGKFQLLTRLAQGGMAEVFLARQSGEGRFERLVVVKRILPDLVEDPRFVDLFLEEARLAALLEHPHIVPIYDFGRIDQAYFLAMPYVHGLSLQRLLRDAVRQELALPLDVAGAIALQALEGLGYAHRRAGLDGLPLDLVHRDISPSNLMINDNGRTQILDFGIATASDSATGDSGTLRGKLAYMSPEQTRDVEVDRRSDLFSLGIVLYEMLAMRRLFRRRGDLDVLKAITEEPIADPREYRPQIPERLAKVALHALERDPAARPASAELMQRELSDALASSNMTADQRRVRRFLQRHFSPQLRERAITVQQAVAAAEEETDSPTRVEDLPVLPPSPRRRRLLGGLIGLGVAAVVGVPTAWLIVRSGRPSGPPLRLGVTPYLPPKVLRRELAPLLRYLEGKLDRPIELVIKENYHAAINALLTGAVDVADLPAYPFLLARRREPALRLLATPVTHRTRSYESYLLVRRDAGLRRIAQLRGKRICFVDRRSTSGYLMPRVMVRRAGFDPDRFFGAVRFSGNHLQALRDLVAGGCDAAAVTSQAYLTGRDHQIPIAGVRILKISEPLPHGVYCATPKLDSKAAFRLREALLSVDMQKIVGRPLLSKVVAISGFAPVEEAGYAALAREVAAVERAARSSPATVPTPATTPATTPAGAKTDASAAAKTDASTGH
jgi:phosphate/phosphite/phosphonate ABC transporter binding protein